jgi:hypothetical protein
MTSAPADLLDFRKVVMTATGLTNPASVGIVGDGAHQRTGGYHEGRDVLQAIGRWTSQLRPGDTRLDYSCRLARDLTGLTNSASAVDIGYQWPRGGNAAWLRFNNLLVTALPADPALAPIRAVNYSPDGSTKKRRDRQNGWAAESTSDTVDVHTHIEFFRDTEGRRGACLNRLGQLINVAITGGSMAASGITMAWGETLDAYLSRIEKIWVPAANKVAELEAKLDKALATLDSLQAAGAAPTTAGAPAPVDVATVKAGVLLAFREIGANIPPGA